MEVGGAGVRCHRPEGILQGNGPLVASERKQVMRPCFLTSCGDLGEGWKDENESFVEFCRRNDRRSDSGVSLEEMTDSQHEGATCP